MKENVFKIGTLMNIILFVSLKILVDIVHVLLKRQRNVFVKKILMQMIKINVLRESVIIIVKHVKIMI